MFIPTNIIDRIKLPFRKDRELYASLREVLGFYPHRIRFYKQALQHKSTSNHSKRDCGEHNERLEFLGDAVLESIVSDILYQHFPDRREGFLTNTRSKLVQRDTLNRLAHELGLDNLLHSNSHSHTHNSYMGGNAFEALVGAVYLDRGYDACMRFIRHRILRQLIDIDKMAAKEVNFKSRLIEWAQKNRVQIEFSIIDEQYEHNSSPVFISRVILEGLDGETGKGYSKKESHQQAAKATLRIIQHDAQFQQAVFAARDARLSEEATMNEQNNII